MVYIDGFNLYRRCLEPYPELKWIDPMLLSSALLPDHDVVKVHYFSAQIRLGTSDDPGSPTRQQIYLRALATLAPQVQVTLGSFRVEKRLMRAHPLERGEDGRYRRVWVKKVEEKGSDVNLATQVLVDAHRGHANLYALLTNDSDQVATFDHLRELGVSRGLISPMDSVRGSKALMKTAPELVACVTRDALLASQMPDQIRDQHGLITRPVAWGGPERSEGPDALASGPSNR